ncbi:MAG: 50S ribosomal protein L24e [Thermoplasmataceae archaeon]
MAIKTCGFCAVNIEPGTGTIYVRRSGSIVNFCSRKCRVNMINLKRVPRRTKWTKEYHTIKSMRKDIVKKEEKPEPVIPEVSTPPETPQNSE